MRSSGTASFSVDPTTDQLWIEAEYYADSSDADRKIVKSTSTADFNGVTDWQTFAVSFTPTQSGVTYIRGWYGKPREAGAADNIFYVDVAPVITSP